MARGQWGLRTLPPDTAAPERETLRLGRVNRAPGQAGPTALGVGKGTARRPSHDLLPGSTLGKAT